MTSGKSLKGLEFHKGNIIKMILPDKREEEWNSHYKPWEETWLIGRQVEAEQSTDSLLDEVDSN